jgi:hypothetical protein
VTVGREKDAVYFSEVHLKENVHTIKTKVDGWGVYEIQFISDQGESTTNKTCRNGSW